MPPAHQRGRLVADHGASASIGPYEAAGAAGFAFWLGLPGELATLAVTAFHGLSQVHDYGLGLVAPVWIMAARLRRPDDAEPASQDARPVWDP